MASETTQRALLTELVANCLGEADYIRSLSDEGEEDEREQQAQHQEATASAIAHAADALDAIARVRAFLDRGTISYRIAVDGFDAYRADILRALDGNDAPSSDEDNNDGCKPAQRPPYNGDDDGDEY